MKTTDFINESFVEDAAAAHQDHEVQMARSDCYNAAKYAIELHKLLKNISEQEGLDGWVSEKITLANDYLRTVTEYLRYEQQSSAQSDMPEFNIGTATQTLDSVLGESVKSTLEEGAFTWYLKAHGRLLSPSTSDTPYSFKSKEEAVAFAKQKYKTNWQNIVPTTYDVPNSLADQPDSGWNEKKLKPVQEDDLEEARKPMVNFDAEDIKKLEKIRDLETLKTQAFMLISRPSEKPMKPEKVAWFKSALERMNSPLKVIKLMYDLLLSGEGHAVIGSKSSMDPNSYRARFNEQDVETQEPKRKPAVVKTNKPIGTRVADIGPGGKEYNVKTNKAWDDQHKEVDEERTVTRDETGKIISWRDESDWRKVDKEKDGRGKVTNLSDKARKETEKLKKQQGVDEGKADPVGSWVVYNGTTVKRFKTREGAKAYAEKNGGKVASSEHYADKIQKQGVAETTSSGSVATSMGGGNGFANGGPGTIARPRMKKKK
jgi:hypothetical protein